MRCTIKTTVNSERVNVPFDAWKLAGDRRFELLSILLKPGERIPVHKNEKDILFYVTAGEGQLLIEDEKLLLQQDNCILVDKNLDREWENCSASNFKVLVFKLL